MAIARTHQFTARVSSIESLSPRMRRIEFTAPDIADQQWPLGCDIAIVLRSDEEDREVRRRYTVRFAAGERLTVDAVLHGHGPGSTWAAQASVGDEIAFFGPRGSVDLPDDQLRGNVLALADEAGLPAVACVADALGDTGIRVLAEVHDENEQYPLSANARSSWVLRGDRPAGQVDLLRSALDELTAGDVPTYAYVLGESRAIVALRDELVGFGMDRRQIYAKGYWNLNARAGR